MKGEPIYGRTGPSDLYSKPPRNPHIENRPFHDELNDDFTDDETSPLTEPIYGGSTRSYLETKGWDVFRNLPPEQDSSSEAMNKKCMAITVRILKVFMYIFCFAVVLGGAVISKSTFLFMTSQVRPKKQQMHCNKDLQRDKQYVSEISNPEMVAWVWVLFGAYMITELGTFVRSTRICVFKSSRRSTLSDFIVVAAFELASAVGMALMTFVVLPELDVIKGAMLTNCLAFVPALFSLLSRNNKENRRLIKVIVDLAALGAQATGFFVWPFVEISRGKTKAWTVPVAILLVSASWWENYVDRRSPVTFIKSLGRVKERLVKTRYFVYSFVSAMKIIVNFGAMCLFLHFQDFKVSTLFTQFTLAFSPHPINITQINSLHPFGADSIVPDIPGGNLLQEIIEIRSYPSTPVYCALILILSAYCSYIFAKFACKIVIQGFSFAFPVTLTVPLTVTLLIASCGLRNDDACFWRETIPHYLYWSCPGGDFLNDFIYNQHAWIWLVWLISQIWISIHIFVPRCERLAPTEKLFVTPMYNGLLVDQSLALNRRRDDEGEVKTEDLELDRFRDKEDQEKVKEQQNENEKVVEEHVNQNSSTNQVLVESSILRNPMAPRVGMEDNDISQYYETISIHTESSQTNTGKIKTSDSITRIYACATMWHETQSEMLEMLKSIFRMDEDQSARRVAQKYLKVVDADYYEFETHIFFDDAFEISDVKDEWMVTNNFVKTFVKCIDEAGSYVHQTNIRLRAPKKVPTPYGGRLVYILPGKTKLFVHLKDKSKIRHKKRWSQCMYMYYLLGHRLMELPITVDRKETLAENTYILTLDGDIDFQPPAVSLLVDLMKKNKNLGAACGRIHPVGSGPMVWYQLFEYAIGHWLQKATEHMIGCVMCSPGCFSLFRAKALMDDNVMRRYTTKSEEPLHFVQYDQGEDRWLCTLLLQRGYRVEYSAASDAYTHCPEGFNEFFNQRRRWVPSTIANIFDLLRNYKSTVKINDNISLPYIMYQTMLMVGTVIGPGTIFLMLVGAFVAAFKISNWVSFTYNLVPIVVYIFTCLMAKPKWQLALSGLLSTLYALVMMAVIVGTALQLGEDGLGSPSAIFLISLSGSFFIAACLHPQEFWCIVPGLIYLLCIPSMYLLLIIYSITNLNVVSWGTREVPKKKSKKELAEEKKAAEMASKQAKSQGIWGLLHNAAGNGEEEGGIDFSLGNVLRIMAFTQKKDNSAEREQLVRIADTLDTLAKRMDHIEEAVNPHSAKSRRKSSRMSARGDNFAANASESADTMDLESEDSKSQSSGITEERDDLINPLWIEERELGRGEVDHLSGVEITFWKDLIDKYLFPIDADSQREAQIKQGLTELRNKAVFFFSIFNALFVLIVFMLTLHKDTLHIDWPFGVKENITITEDEQIIITKEYLHLEPIGIVLVFFFFAIILIQFIAMLFHRMGTIAHILASTELNWCRKNEEFLSDEALIEKNAVEIVKQMQRLRGLDGEMDSESSSSNRLAHRKTIHMLEKQKSKKRAIGTLDVAFKKRFFALNGAGQDPDVAGKVSHTPILGGSKMPMRRETLKALEQRRDHVVSERKQSKIITLGASNPINNNKDKHRSSAKVTGDTVDKIFAAAGVDNVAFDRGNGSSNTDDEASSTTRNSGRSHHAAPTTQITWKDHHRPGLLSSDQLSSSANSKM